MINNFYFNSDLIDLTNTKESETASSKSINGLGISINNKNLILKKS